MQLCVRFKVAEQAYQGSSRECLPSVRQLETLFESCCRALSTLVFTITLLQLLMSAMQKTSAEYAALDQALYAALAMQPLPIWINSGKGGWLPNQKEFDLNTGSLTWGARLDFYRGANADDFQNEKWEKLKQQYRSHYRSQFRRKYTNGKWESTCLAHKKCALKNKNRILNQCFLF